MEINWLIIINFDDQSSAYPIISLRWFTYHGHNSKRFSATGTSGYHDMRDIHHWALREQ